MSFEIIQADPTVRMPAGTYVVGDPCYSVPDHRWMEWLASGWCQDDDEEEDDDEL